jgi:hypothetical protein
MNMSEMSRIFSLEKLDNGEIEVVATPEECALVAQRLLLPAIASIRCRWSIRLLAAKQVAAKGHLVAKITQECVVSLDPFPAKVDERFEVRFVPEADMNDEDASEEIDEIPYSGFEIDLGEATAEQLALSLDPYPRKPGAELHPSASDDTANPFAALAKLRQIK